MKAPRSTFEIVTVVALLALCVATLIGTRLHAQEPPSAPARVAVPAQSRPNDQAVAPATERVRPVDTAQAPRDLSPWSMFLHADIFVKGVMIGLMVASLATWTIFIGKLIELFVARRRLVAALGRVAPSRSLAQAQSDLGRSGSVLGAFVAAALGELRLSEDTFIESSIKERVASRFSEIVKGESREVRRGMSVLATIGATAPFVGLFGTVWGIMNSFIGISKSQTTNLAVVAPGIAEALLATGIGLAAAIPAVIIYNHFNRKTRRHLDLVARASGTIGRLLSRDLDRIRLGGVRARAAE
jgi:biopolymer transport protein ExbB